MYYLLCLQDILKRNTHVYKGRIYLDTSEVIDVPDGKGNICFVCFFIFYFFFIPLELLFYRDIKEGFSN
jgi:hypothetical protein